MSVTTSVLIADRSLSVRAVLRRLLGEARGVEVVAEADDGGKAVRLVAEKSPAAVVLDLDLPSLGGRALVERIAARTRAPIFVLAPKRRHESTRVAMSLSRIGVVAVFPKPESPREWAALGRTLGDAVRQAGSHGAHERPAVESEGTPVVGRELRHVAIGGSTGGPGSMYELLSTFGRRPRFGFAVVQHIADGFEKVLADWLTVDLGMDVGVARHGEELAPGKVRIAPSGQHLAIDRGGRLRLVRLAAPVGGHRPSIDVLFRSLLDQPPRRVAAVLLSGMGEDGARAMSELREAGVLTIAQNEASCAVFGMPRAAIESRGAAFALAPRQIGRLLVRAGGATA